MLPFRLLACRAAPWLLLVFTARPAGQAFAQAAIPVVSATVPQAAAPGQTIDVKIRGGNLAGPTQLWTSFPCETSLPADIPGNGSNAAEVTYRLKVPAEAGLGVGGLRVATAQGISALRLFVIDDLPSVQQARPNQTPNAAQSLTLPVAVDGYVDALTRDFYKFQAAAGQRVAIEVLARRLGTPLDTLVRLLDARGRELAYSDDAPGIGSDSMLSYTFQDAGEYFVEVRDLSWKGGANFQYRLRLGDFPCVSVPYPMGVQKGASANVGFAGIDAADAAAVPLHLPADLATAWLNLGAKRVGGASSGFSILAVSDTAEVVEAEPNDQPGQATPAALGANLNGRFDRPEDRDLFLFPAKSGQRFQFLGVTGAQGSPADLFMRLLKADGGELASADDAGANDGLIDFTFPADGEYMLEVSDLQRQGGAERAYRVLTRPFAERFELAASADTINVPAGGLALVTVTATRGNFGGPIELSLLDAPEGIVATPAVIGPGLTSTVMTISASPQAAAGKVHLVRIAGTSKTGNTEFRAVATVTAAQRAALSNIRVPPPSLSETVALGVNPAPFFALKTEKPELIFGKDLSASVKVVSTRAGDFAEEIALAVFPAPPAPGLPPGVTAAVKPIAKGTNEVEIVFSATNQAPLGEFSAVLLGTGKQGNSTLTQPIPALRLSLRAPFQLKPDFGGGKLAKGQTLKVKVVAERNPAYAGPITLTFQNLPKGVSAPSAMIAAGQTEVEFELTAAADAAVGAVNNIIVQGEGMNGNAKLQAASAAAALEVQ